MAERGVPAEEVRSVLIVNVSRIGDTLLATPAMRAIARAFPGAAITCLAHPKRAEILENLPFITHLGRIEKRAALLRGRLRRKRFDLGFVYGFDEALVAYALRAATRVVAFRQRSETLNQRLAAAVPAPPPQSMHAVHLALRLCDALQIPHAGFRLAYAVSANEHAWAADRLRALGLARHTPLIGLQVASFPTKRYRDWPVESFAALARRILAARPDAHFLIFGGPEERQRTAWLAAALGAAATRFAGALSLRQTAAVMSLTHLYVGVDTGPTHIMGCFDIPLVALYHCNSPSRIYGALEHPNFYALDHPGRDPCPENPPMSEISVDRVLATVDRALGAGA